MLLVCCFNFLSLITLKRKHLNQEAISGEDKTGLLKMENKR